MKTHPTAGGITARTNVDIAIGILVAFHGCAPEEAFTELAEHARIHSISLAETARALTAVARATHAHAHVSASAMVHARDRWGRFPAARGSAAPVAARDAA
ncbi:ANTAR domain-containing protein [Rhodococcus koreensis]|uniref:ANTAR domain-containing protein n=1 Tax=Rhodococcus koreensis TaxID=99653 RepID=UPI003671C3AF